MTNNHRIFIQKIFEKIQEEGFNESYLIIKNNGSPVYDSSRHIDLLNNENFINNINRALAAPKKYRGSLSFTLDDRILIEIKNGYIHDEYNILPQFKTKDKQQPTIEERIDKLALDPNAIELLQLLKNEIIKTQKQNQILRQEAIANRQAIEKLQLQVRERSSIKNWLGEIRHSINQQADKWCKQVDNIKSGAKLIWDDGINAGKNKVARTFASPLVLGLKALSRFQGKEGIIDFGEGVKFEYQETRFPQYNYQELTTAFAPIETENEEQILQRKEFNASPTEVRAQSQADVNPPDNNYKAIYESYKNCWGEKATNIAKTLKVKNIPAAATAIIVSQMKFDGQDPSEIKEILKHGSYYQSLPSENRERALDILIEQVNAKAIDTHQKLKVAIER